MVDWIEYGKEIYSSKFVASAEKFVLLKDSIYKAAKKQALGLVYYLQTELGYKNLGLDDEFGTDDHLALTVSYIRQGMRVERSVRMVLDDIFKPYDRESKLIPYIDRCVG